MLNLTQRSYSGIHLSMFCGVGGLSKDAKNESFNNSDLNKQYGTNYRLK